MKMVEKKNTMVLTLLRLLLTSTKLSRSRLGFNIYIYIYKLSLRPQGLFIVPLLLIFTSLLQANGPEQLVLLL